MAHVVGPKGQVVIEKDIRDGLGVRPGWLALQQRVGDHVEIHFIPPEHDRSLAGILSSSIKRSFPTETDLSSARDEAWHRHVHEDAPPSEENSSPEGSA